MHKEYIDRLITCLKTTKIYDGKGTVIKDYEEAMDQIVALFTDIKRSGRQIFFIGNGGSAAIASHMTADFMKNGGMKTYSLYDTAVTTCMGNDYSYVDIFSRPLEFLGKEGDLLVAISSSGNSPNIINAIQIANAKNMKIITFSGFHKENTICGLGEYNVHVDAKHYGIVESIHNLILQQIVDVIKERDGECL